MYWKRLSAFVHHRLKANNRHGTHSPYVYQFLEDVLYDRSEHQAYVQIDRLINKLDKDHSILEYDDPGARKIKRKLRVKDLAKKASAGRKFAHLLYRINKFYAFEQSLELGTNLGLGSAAIALGSPNGRLITMEAVKELCDIAQSNFEQLGIAEGIELIQADFDEKLEEVLGGLQKLDLVYMDGNHRYEPTVRYFKQVLPKLHNDSWLIMDDIHWSDEMENAWEEIRNHPSVKVDIDLYRFGILLFRKEMSREHFHIRF